jgi:hypothetical protein
MPLEEEDAFLAPQVEQARGAGGVVSPLRAALAEHLGPMVVPSVLYRMLARRGWRRVVLNAQHPKQDPLAQAVWKQDAQPRWRPCWTRRW